MTRHLVLACGVLIAAVFGGLIPDLLAEEGQRPTPESVLVERLTNMSVVTKLDMPAHKDGVDLRMWQTPPARAEEIQDRIDKHGVAIAAYRQPSMITAIKRKRKHIEVHLNGGGWSGRVPSVPWQLDRSVEEVGLSRPAPPEERAAIRRRLAELSKERGRADDQVYRRYLAELDEYDRKKRAAGSRFNIRYRNSLTDQQLTPESVMTALRDYVVFEVSE